MSTEFQHNHTNSVLHLGIKDKHGLAPNPDHIGLVFMHTGNRKKYKILSPIFNAETDEWCYLHSSEDGDTSVLFSRSINNFFGYRVVGRGRDAREVLRYIPESEIGEELEHHSRPYVAPEPVKKPTLYVIDSDQDKAFHLSALSVDSPERAEDFTKEQIELREVRTGSRDGSLNILRNILHSAGINLERE